MVEFPRCLTLLSLVLVARLSFAVRKWSPASTSQLRGGYLYEELCALGLTECRRSGPHSSLLEQCKLGFVRKKIWAEVERQQKKSCVSRGFRDRKGIMSSWTDDESGVYGEDRGGLAQSLFNKQLLHDTGTGSVEGDDNKSGCHGPTQHIVFLGDSVSSQLAQFLICDVLRELMNTSTHTTMMHPPSCVADYMTRHENVTSSPYLQDDMTVKYFNRSVADIAVPFWQTHSLSEESIKWGFLRIHNQQFNLPCLQNNRSGKCYYPKEEAVKSYVSNLLASYTSLQGIYTKARSHTMIIFNYGLHIPRKYTWTVKPMLSALLEQAKLHSGKYVTFYFRETSSQSFTGSPGNFISN